MKILLIQPRMRKRPMDTDLKTRMSPSQALLTLAGLTPPEHGVSMVNENAEAVDFACGAQLVGITVTLDVMPRAIEIARTFRAMGVPVVAGGIHVSCDPEGCAAHFDAICVGPAERVWARMLADAQRKQLQPVYQDMEGFSGEELAFPARDRIDLRRYLYANVITTSRGCPHRCDFCYNSAASRQYIRRPIDAVMDEIARMGTRHILFIDDNFIGDIDYARALLTRMRGMGLKWNAAVTTRIADHPDLLDLMAEVGCQSLFIGFESINNGSLENVHKDNRFERYGQLIHEIHRRGIMINASMVFGLDGDGPDVFRRTLDWLVDSKIETLTSHILTPYPGTALHRRMQAEGRIIDHDLANYNTAHVVFAPRGMTARELYDGYLWMYRRFYSLRNILRRLPEHKAQRKSFLLFNFLYRKYGRVTSALARLIPMRWIGLWATRISYKIK